MVFDFLTIILFAVLYGVTMKVADLLNEHGLKWFRGADILFGVLWGVFGALLALGDNLIANVVLAQNVAFIMRNRLDYLNHQIAASIIIIGFLFSSQFSPWAFLAFYIVFLVFGSLKDYVDDILKKRKGLMIALNEAMLYYPVPTLAYCLLYGGWVLFWAFLAYTVSYDATKYVARTKGYK